MNHSWQEWNLNCPTLGLPSDLLLEHGSPRLVYGVALTRNFREYLLGLDSEPEYLVPLENAAHATRLIAEWWTERWLANRIQNEDILSHLARHQLTYPVRHGARITVPEDAEQPLFPFADIVTQKF